MILFEKFGQHQPLNWQSERYTREGVELSLSTLADQVASAVALRPLHALIEAHVLAATRLHGDDTTVPILGKGQAETGRVWVYVRDDRPFGGNDPPAALFYASRDRTREHPERHLRGWAGILQADAFDGYNRLYLPDRKPGLIIKALCWSHARRKFFELADFELADIAANARQVAFSVRLGEFHPVAVQDPIEVLDSLLLCCDEAILLKQLLFHFTQLDHFVQAFPELLVVRNHSRKRRMMFSHAR